MMTMMTPIPANIHITIITSVPRAAGRGTSWWPAAPWGTAGATRRLRLARARAPRPRALARQFATGDRAGGKAGRRHFGARG